MVFTLLSEYMSWAILWCFVSVVINSGEAGFSSGGLAATSSICNWNRKRFYFNPIIIKSRDEIDQ